MAFNKLYEEIGYLSSDLIELNHYRSIRSKELNNQINDLRQKIGVYYNYNSNYDIVGVKPEAQSEYFRNNQAEITKLNNQLNELSIQLEQFCKSEFKSNHIIPLSEVQTQLINKISNPSSVKVSVYNNINSIITIM